MKAKNLKSKIVEALSKSHLHTNGDVVAKGYPRVHEDRFVYEQTPRLCTEDSEYLTFTSMVKLSKQVLGKRSSSRRDIGKDISGLKSRKHELTQADSKEREDLELSLGHLDDSRNETAQILSLKEYYDKKTAHRFVKKRHTSDYDVIKTIAAKETSKMKFNQKQTKLSKSPKVKVSKKDSSYFVNGRTQKTSDTLQKTFRSLKADQSGSIGSVQRGAAKRPEMSSAKHKAYHSGNSRLFTKRVSTSSKKQIKNGHETPIVGNKRSSKLNKSGEGISQKFDAKKKNEKRDTVKKLKKSI
eukprot:CAMPEP_0168335762 /NCGR_PEP_ID=MMETSP0213-20121227/11116_1 /TAXON_ID=151035 /ORGANISM="Euplotes harpa, Strain FSP1.4" /LENGTH=297 /DNA_ID=CAMNT_0008340779 /DNA_START=76 /DNA_END=969 /DNA_ORIENTATION=+